MTALLRTPATVVWVVLVIATIASWTLGTAHGMHNHSLASVLILLIAFIKVRLVGLYFMELREAPTALRGVVRGLLHRGMRDGPRHVFACVTTAELANPQRRSITHTRRSHVSTRDRQTVPRNHLGTRASRQHSAARGHPAARVRTGRGQGLQRGESRRRCRRVGGPPANWC